MYYLASNFGYQPAPVSEADYISLILFKLFNGLRGVIKKSLYELGVITSLARPAVFNRHSSGLYAAGCLNYLNVMRKGANAYELGDGFFQY